MTDPLPAPPVDTRGLFLPLHEELMALLRGLSAEDWTRLATPRWTVRDLVAHLLDTEVRRLSLERDGLPPVPPDVPIRSHEDLVAFLDGLNADWTRAARRLSPRVLISLVAATGPELAAFVSSLDPDGPAFFPVAWAGQAASPTWLDIGREYTERWHHQQQIRIAAGRPLLTAPRWLRPVLEVAAHAFPRAWTGVAAPEGAVVEIEIRGPAGGRWALHREGSGWTLGQGRVPDPVARVVTDEDTAWRFLHKLLPPESAASRIALHGELARPFLRALAIMG